MKPSHPLLAVLIAFTFLQLRLPAQSPTEVSLLVFRDDNRNGIQEVGEPALPNVVVSDQLVVMRTDAGGRATFLCDKQRTRFVYASVPETCSLKSPGWVRIPFSDGEASPRVDLVIGLHPLSPEEEALRASGAWTFIQTSDIHVAKPEDAETFRLDLEEISRLQPAPVFIAATGDLVNRGNDAEEFKNYVAGLSGTELPHFSIIGNHDIDRGPLRVSHYEEHLGPRLYSWNVPHYRCLAVDSVNYNPEQEAWLLAELATLDPGQRAIVFQHYLPSDTFLETMSSRLVAAIFSGHWHGQRMRRYKDILDCNTSPFRFGGIDRSPRGFRVISVHPDGSLTTEFRAGGLEQHLRIVAPEAGDAARDGVVAVVVAFQDSDNPAAGAALELGPTAIPSNGSPAGIAGKDEHGHRAGPEHGHEHAEGHHHHEPHDALTHSKLDKQGSWFWVGHYRPAKPEDRQRFDVTITTKNGERITARHEAVLRKMPRPDFQGTFAQHRGSELKTGFISSEVAYSHGISLLWTARAGPGNTGGAVVAGGRVIVAAAAESTPEDAAIACLDASTGAVIWRAPTDGSVVNTPAIDGGRVIAVTQTGHVHGFAIEDGAPHFKLLLGKSSMRWDISAPAVRDGIAWLGTGQGFGAVDLKAGKLLWSRGTEAKPPEPWTGSDWWPNNYQSPAVSGSFAALGLRTGLFVMDASSGEILWSLKCKNALPAFDASGTLLWALLERRLCAFRQKAADGTAWEKVVSVPDDLGDTTTMPAICGDLIVVATGGGDLRAYTREGCLLWSHQLPRGITSQRPYARGEAHVTGSPLIVGRNVIAGATDGVLRVFDLESGALVASRDFGVPVTGSPAFAGNIIYVTTFDGNVVALAPAPPADPRPPRVIAHRGGALEAPENTLAALRRALELGCDFVEIDVRLTKDGIPVVIHDATLDRTTSVKGSGTVCDLTFKELRQFDVGKHFAASFENEKIPTLEDVLTLPWGRTRLMIELKRKVPPRFATLRDSDQLLVRTVAELLLSTPRTDAYFVGSVSPELLDIFHALAPQVPLIGIAGNEDEIAAHLPCPLTVLAIEQKLISPARVQDLKRRKFEVWAWTVQKPEEIRSLIEAGVDGIITDIPAQHLR